MGWRWWWYDCHCHRHTVKLYKLTHTPVGPNRPTGWRKERSPGSAWSRVVFTLSYFPSTCFTVPLLLLFLSFPQYNVIFIYNLLTYTRLSIIPIPIIISIKWKLYRMRKVFSGRYIGKSKTRWNNITNTIWNQMRENERWNYTLCCADYFIAHNYDQT